MKKDELVALIERLTAQARMPMRSVSQREEMQLREDPAFIAVEQYAEMLVLDGEIGTHRGVRLFRPMPRWNP